MAPNKGHLRLVKSEFDRNTQFEYFMSGTIASAFNFISFWQGYYDENESRIGLSESIRASLHLGYNLLDADLLEVDKTFSWAFEEPQVGCLEFQFNLNNLDYFNLLKKKYPNKDLPQHYMLDLAINTYIDYFKNFFDTISKNCNDVPVGELEKQLEIGFNIDISDVKKRAMREGREEVLSLLLESYKNKDSKLVFGNSKNYDHWSLGLY